MTEKTKNIISLILILLLFPPVAYIFSLHVFVDESDLKKATGRIVSLKVNNRKLEIVLGDSQYADTYSLYNLSGYSEILKAIKTGDFVEISCFHSEMARIVRNGVEVYSLGQFRNKYAFLVIFIVAVTLGGASNMVWKLYRRSKGYRRRKKQKSQSHFHVTGSF